MAMPSDLELLASKLSKYEPRGIKPGLEQIKNLLQILGNPEKQVPFIHVAGTNGKGSVCAYMGSILAKAGYQVGVFTSPHLVSWTERFQINGEAIAPSTLLALINYIEEAIASHNQISQVELHPTHFELLTALAWVYFDQQQVDIAVMEVGLGGRFDCTNVKDDPLVAVITSIGLDHCQILGNTLDLIAREKAGIIKPGRPAIAAAQIPDLARTAINDYAHTMANQVQWIEPWDLIDGQAYYQGQSYNLSLQGAHQLSNIAIAIATIEELQRQGWKIEPGAITAGLTKTNWPGRLQWVNYQGHQLLLDGAHNPEAANTLRTYANQQASPLHWIIGILATKDATAILKSLLHPSDYVYFVPIPGANYHGLNHLVAIAQSLGLNADRVKSYADLEKALKLATANVGTKIVCGSLYLIGHALQVIDQQQSVSD
jgi:dihydrofolate synthase/folylpolyglutamate synthase